MRAAQKSTFVLLVAAACGQTLALPDGGGVDASTLDVAVDAVGDAANDSDVIADAANADANDAVVEAGCPPVTHTGSTAQTFQIDALHSGAQLGDHLTLPLCQRWKRNFIGPVSYPVVGSGNVFVTIADQSNAVLYAIDTATGANAWGPVLIGSNVKWSAPAYDQGLVFAAVANGVLVAFDAVTGAQKWTKSFGNGLGSAPTPRNGLLYVTTNYGLDALNESDGSVVWASIGGGDTASAPNVDDSGAYGVYGCNEAYAFEPLDGAVHWHHYGSCIGIGSVTPRVANQRVYTRSSTAYQMLSALDGSYIGTYNAGMIPVYGGPNVAIVTGLGVSAVTMPDMSQTLWTYSVTSDYPAMPPLVIGSNVVFATLQGALYVVDLATGKLADGAPLGGNVNMTNEWTIQQPTSALGAADGFLFVPVQNSLLAY